MTSPSTLDELLNVYWLRPETALWREIDIRAMRSFAFRSPSLDLGCGDGIFSFVRAGGGFEKSFDAFRAMARLDRFFENIDVYDVFDESIRPAVARRPGYSIDCGFDHKENLLGKARSLSLYRELKAGDANRRLPFPDESFNSVFSNMVYWLDDPEAAIAEIGRILRPDGQACLMLPNKTFPEFSFYNQLFVKTGNPDWRFLENLDRGRFADNLRQAHSSETWERMFRDADLRIKRHVAHLSKTAVQMWDIGLRPLFPVLHRMTEAIAPDQLPSIKDEFVATLRQFLGPIVAMDDLLRQEEEPAFHCYILMA